MICILCMIMAPSGRKTAATSWWVIVRIRPDHYLRHSLEIRLGPCDTVGCHIWLLHWVRHRVTNICAPTMLQCPTGRRSPSRGGFTLLMDFIWLAVVSVSRGERFLEGVSTIKTRSASQPKLLTISRQMFMMTCGLRNNGRWRTIFSPCTRLMWIMIFPSIPQFISECHEALWIFSANYECHTSYVKNLDPSYAEY